MSLLGKLSLLLLLTGLPGLAYAQAVGHVIFTKGEVTAVDARSVPRALRRGDPVNVGDTLRTGEDALAQVRFVDDAMLSLRPKSEYRVDAYRYDKSDAGAVTSLATLIEGGYRTITGLIARLKPDSYKVKTPVAIIGVRGTNYEAILSDGLYVAAWQGTVVLENQAGLTLLGAGAPYNFAHIVNFSMAPQGMTQPPPMMMKDMPMPPPDSGPGSGPGYPGAPMPTQPPPNFDPGTTIILPPPGTTPAQ